MNFIIYLYIFIIGAVIGSFLNVVICRLPLRQSIIKPRSHCPKCGNILRPKQLIPIISFVIQKGKCTNCKQPISIIYPLIECLTGFLFVLIFYIFGFQTLTIVYWILIACFIVIAVIDWRHMIIPDELNLIIASLGIGSSLSGLTLPIGEALLGGLLGGGILLILAIISRGGMGGGDIKFLAAVGLFTGWKLVFVLIFIASLIASGYGVINILRHGYQRGRQIPFGPFLVVSTMITLLYGNQLIDYYLSLF